MSQPEGTTSVDLPRVSQSDDDKPLGTDSSSAVATSSPSNKSRGRPKNSKNIVKCPLCKKATPFCSVNGSPHDFSAEITKGATAEDDVKLSSLLGGSTIKSSSTTAGKKRAATTTATVIDGSGGSTTDDKTKVNEAKASKRGPRIEKGAKSSDIAVSKITSTMPLTLDELSVVSVTVVPSSTATTTTASKRTRSLTSKKNKSVEEVTEGGVDSVTSVTTVGDHASPIAVQPAPKRARKEAAAIKKTTVTREVVAEDGTVTTVVEAIVGAAPPTTTRRVAARKPKQPPTTTTISLDGKEIAAAGDASTDITTSATATTATTRKRASTKKATATSETVVDVDGTTTTTTSSAEPIPKKRQVQTRLAIGKKKDESSATSSAATTTTTTTTTTTVVTTLDAEGNPIVVAPITSDSKMIKKKPLSISLLPPTLRQPFNKAQTRLAHDIFMKKGGVHSEAHLASLGLSATSSGPRQRFMRFIFNYSSERSRAEFVRAVMLENGGELPMEFVSGAASSTAGSSTNNNINNSEGAAGGAPKKKRGPPFKVAASTDGSGVSAVTIEQNAEDVCKEGVDSTAPHAASVE